MIWGEEMKIGASDMKKAIEEIYKKLDSVTPVDFDCGSLCGEACCVYDLKNPEEELALYLLPGEELMYEDSDSFDLYYFDRDEIEYPPSWDDVVYLVKCRNPPKCDRSIRPIQCRTFPLVPHIDENGEFHLILDETEFPYECPIASQHMKFNDDFLTVTFDVWKKLISNPLVYDFVEMDSRLRDERTRDYEIVI